MEIVTDTPDPSSDKLSADNYFAIIPEWIIYADVSSNAIRLYALLARHADKDTGQGYPSRKRIRKLISLTDRQITNALAELGAIGAVIVRRRYLENGGYTSNLYTIVFNKAATIDTPLYQMAGSPLLSDCTIPTVNLAPSPTVKSTSLTRVITNKSHITRETTVVNPFYEALANHLAQSIYANGSKMPKVTAAWVNDMRLLIERDGRSVEQVHAAIEWCQNDNFWRGNILSPSKLRMKYDQLRLRAQAEVSKTEPKGLAAIKQIRAEEEAKRNLANGESHVIEG